VFLEFLLVLQHLVLLEVQGNHCYLCFLEFLEDLVNLEHRLNLEILLLLEHQVVLDLQEYQ
jgi:hypothetical protein